jgi:hypothetical protein
MRKSKRTKLMQARTPAMGDGGRATLAKAIGRAAARAVTGSKREASPGEESDAEGRGGDEDESEAAAQAGHILPRAQR